MMGLDYTESEEGEDGSLDDVRDRDMEELAKAEHDRWMAFLETEGWSVSTREDVMAYRASDVSKGRHNCPLLKMHPYICEYEKLKGLSEEIEGKDTTVYDKQLIVRIPEILGNKWGAAKRRFRIIKKA